MSEKKWYAVYTKVRWEKKVSELLAKKKIESYCPLNKVTRQWADRKKIIAEPLFTSYVFVKVSAAEHTQLLKTDGIISFVYWLGKPAVIRDAEIDMIQNFLKDYPAITLEKTNVNINDMVRVISGPLMSQEGHVIAVKSKTVKIMLPSLGYIMSAEVENANIEVIHENLNLFVGNTGKLALG